jgi:hypothetical protein
MRPMTMAPRAATAAPAAALVLRALLVLSAEEPASKGLVCGQGEGRRVRARWSCP